VTPSASPRGPENAISVETLATGRTRVLSTFPAGSRSRLVVQAPDGRLSVVTVRHDIAGPLYRILGVFTFAEHRLTELAGVIDIARAAVMDAPPA
jgi:hypothetical protein